jgi:hypothetical protein
MGIVTEIQIYWDDLTEECKQRLIEKGFNNTNVVDGIFPITTVVIADSSMDSE